MGTRNLRSKAIAALAGVKTALTKPCAFLFKNTKQSEESLARHARELARANAHLEVQIAQRKRAEDDLRALNESLEARVVERTAAAEGRARQFQGLLESSPDATVIFNDRGEIVLVNAQTEQLFGYSREELLGRRVETLFPERFRTNPREHRAGFFPAGLQVQSVGMRTELHGLRKDGREVPVEISLGPLETNEGTLVSAAVRDISERKQAEDVLRKSESSLAEAQRIAHLGNWDWDIVRDEMWWSDEIYRILGQPTQAFEATYETFLNAVHPDDRAFVQRSEDEALFEKKPFSIDHRIILRDGSQRFVHEEAEVWFAEDDRPIRMVGTVQDVTERRRAEEQIKRQTRELEQRTEELVRSNAELEQFVHIASHDLQEPLRMVTSYTQLLAQRYEGKLDSDADDFIAYASGGAMRMQELIQDLLVYSRVVRTRTEFAPTDCETVLQHTLAEMEVLIEESGAVVTHDALPTVTVNQVQLGQVFQNLIENAIKFRCEDPPRVHVSAQQQGDGWVFSVRDNGIGIDPEYAERVFVIFQRLHSNDEYPGTGMGLTICKKIAEGHGGRIWVESEAGKGATFHFSIPPVAETRLAA